MTLFQIQEAEEDPLTRTAALCSLISALMSLSYGITYIIRFGNMRSMYRASRWAEVNSFSLSWLSVFDSDLAYLSLVLQPHIIGGSKDGNGHLLECLGPARSAGGLACVVRARVRRRDHVVRLALGRQRRDATGPAARTGVWSAHRNHVPAIARAHLLCVRHTDVQELWREWA